MQFPHSPSRLSSPCEDIILDSKATASIKALTGDESSQEKNDKCVKVHAQTKKREVCFSSW